MIKIIRSRDKQSIPHFYLRNPKSKFDTPILLYYKFSSRINKRLTYSTGQKINPKYWDEKKERAKPSVVFDFKKLNIQLDNLLTNVNNLVKDDNISSIIEFRNKLDDLMGRKYNIINSEGIESFKAPLFLEWVTTFILNEESRVDSSYYTINKYKSEIKKIAAFIKFKYKNDDISFDEIDLKFCFAYKQFLYKPPYENSQNTVSKSFEVLSAFIKKAQKDTYVNSEGNKVNIHNNMVYQDDEWAVSRIDTSKSILTFNQLLHLYNFDFSGNPTLSRVRYLFLVMAFTGLRISDLLSLSRDSIILNDDGSLFLRVFIKKGRQKKKDTEIIIPVITELKEIFELYNYKIPNDITEPSMNKYIKEVCRKAGFNQSVQMKYSKGGKPIVETLPLYSTITNHSARFSFITFAINEFGISAEQLQKITGQTLKVLLAYEKGNKKENALKVANAIIKQRTNEI